MGFFLPILRVKLIYLIYLLRDDHKMIHTSLTEKLGIKCPIISAPMGPFYTTELTAAVSEAGGLGILSHTNLEGKSSLKK